MGALLHGELILVPRIEENMNTLTNIPQSITQNHPAGSAVYFLEYIIPNLKNTKPISTKEDWLAAFSETDGPRLVKWLEDELATYCGDGDRFVFAISGWAPGKDDQVLYLKVVKYHRLHKVISDIHEITKKLGIPMMMIPGKRTMVLYSDIPEKYKSPQ
jgi:hypothetical protein